MKQDYMRLRGTHSPAKPFFAGAGFRRASAILAILGLSLGSQAQQRQAPSFFQEDGAARAAAANSPLAAALFSSRPLTLDLTAIRAALATAPRETQAGTAPLVLALPLPDGSTARFAVREAPVMAPALAAQFPAIKTYAGVGLDDVHASVRLDVTPQGFHAQVLSPTTGAFYIDPVSRTDVQHYLSFFKKDMNRAAVGGVTPCGFTPSAEDVAASKQREALASSTAGRSLAAPSGSLLRTYRLALACTPEYSVTKGNTMAGVMAGEVTSVNRVVGVYEKELAVRLELVANNNQLVFLNGTGTQPNPAYSNNNGSAMLTQNQSNVDRIIGNANYDIGHVFSTGGGGVAGLGVVCNSTRKAQGVTGSASPVGDAFDIDYVAHEMGHQFAGNHPFNGDAGSCAGGNRNANTAWEPGSGSTIMAYAGICTATNDLQPNSDATFHTGNFQEMRTFIENSTCNTTANLMTGNTAPVVTVPTVSKTLPIGTPFKLTATATDADNDPLTYSWEEMDLGAQSSPTATQVAGQNVPLFRSFNPTVSGTRYFPRLSNLLANTTAIGERLPTVTRTMRFRATARDQHSGPAGVIGGVDFSSFVNLNVSSTAGPFVVTAPNTAVTWTAGAAHTVTWNVAGTTAAPVSCATVNLLLSTDGGLTYPTVLLSSVPNNGSAVVIAPSVTSSQARLMVEAADNYFFDISNVNFSIAPASGPVITSFSPGGGQPGTVVTILGGGFTGATAVSFNGTPATFVVNSATQITATVAAGTTTGTITVTAPSGTATSTQSFVVGNPPSITSFTPASGAVGSTIVITGTNFLGATGVSIGGVNAPMFTVNSANQITVTVPAGAITGPITVTSPIASGTSATNYTVIPAPTITSFTPTAGPIGSVVVITGTNFTGATQVAFNGVNAPMFTVTSATSITVTVPVGATNGPISVTGPGGVATSTTNFAIPPANDLCANAIPIMCGQTVTGTTVGATTTGDPTATCTTSITTGGVFYTIVGTGANITLSTCSATTTYDSKLYVFTGTCGSYTCVAGNDDNAACTGNTLTSLVTFPSVAGTTYLIFVAGYNTAAGPFGLSATCAPVVPAPAITSLNPVTGPVGTAVTITGTNFTGASRVAFNGTNSIYTVVNATTITTTVPTGATTGNVVVTTPAGASNGSLFTVTIISSTANASGSQFSVYPNPASAKVGLHITLASATKAATATLHNVLGQVVSTRSFSGNSADLATAGLAAGTYLLTVQVAGQSPTIQRVVLE
ncbi:hypothetical protein GCM10023185_02470 [Hymenobacter saemangeumensis]|uniref:IPT/TIG domain-containing protein n=1 Tax=Hymenobacter saemangeumensis TaxID=1084522 RepID=A0ABP8HY83_9BACT